jgi:hypothetical protein
MNFIRMLALGLATEVAITVLTPRFVAFFLIPFIVVNVSVTVVPNDIQPWVRSALTIWGYTDRWHSSTSTDLDSRLQT